MMKLLLCTMPYLSLVPTQAYEWYYWTLSSEIVPKKTFQLLWCLKTLGILQDNSTIYIKEEQISLCLFFQLIKEERRRLLLVHSRWSRGSPLSGRSLSFRKSNLALRTNYLGSQPFSCLVKIRNLAFVLFWNKCIRLNIFWIPLLANPCKYILVLLYSWQISKSKRIQSS